MPYHDNLPFLSLHKAKVSAGLRVDRPATPDGLGDMYWATNANAGLGALFLTNIGGTSWVEFTNVAPELDDLTDVTITTPADGDGLIYVTSTSTWINSANVTSMSALSDVDLAGLADGDTLIYDSVGSVFVAGTPTLSISDLTDVGTITQVKGDIIASSGTLFNKVGVGSNNQLLTADSTQTYGIKWSTFSTDFNVILTANGEVLIDSNGNVITTI